MVCRKKVRRPDAKVCRSISRMQQYYQYLKQNPQFNLINIPLIIYPKLTRAYTVRTGLFECPAVLLFAPCTSGTRPSSALQGTQAAACLALRPQAGLISAFSRKRNEVYWNVHPLTATHKMPESDRRRRVSPCQFVVYIIYIKLPFYILSNKN